MEWLAAARAASAMAPPRLLSLPTPLLLNCASESRPCLGRNTTAGSRSEEKRRVRFDRTVADTSRPTELGLRSCSKKLRACIVFADHESGYGPSSSSSSSRNQYPDNENEENDKADDDSSKIGKEDEALMSDEERLAEEQARRRREELVRQALEEARIKKEVETLFKLSQQAYGRGVYDKSVEMLEDALTKVPGGTNLGGEMQLWLALAYDAMGRHADCIAVYKRLESSHPNKNLRKQAADLRFIAEAPKLKISQDEMVKIPLMEKDFDRKAKRWSQLVKEKRRKPMKKSAQSKDYLEDWLVWKPPRWEKSPYFWVAITVWLTLVGFSLIFQN